MCALLDRFVLKEKVLFHGLDISLDANHDDFFFQLKWRTLGMIFLGLIGVAFIVFGDLFFPNLEEQADLAKGSKQNVLEGSLVALLNP